MRGRLRAPPSKSATHRALNLALLAGSPMVIERPLRAEDTDLFLAALGVLGWRMEEGGAQLTLHPGQAPQQAEIYCGNAGTMLRFLTATSGHAAW